MATPGLTKYYIYDPNAKDELGGIAVQTEEDTGNKFVMMSASQANYWLSLLAIGREKFTDLPDNRKKSLNQMWGGKLVAPEGQVMAQAQHGGGPQVLQAAQQNVATEQKRALQAKSPTGEVKAGSTTQPGAQQAAPARPRE